jgi:hypothetical protein
MRKIGKKGPNVIFMVHERRRCVEERGGRNWRREQNKCTGQPDMLKVK